MKRIILALGFGALVAAPDAWAATAESGTWQKGCQSGSAFATKSLQPGGVACWTPSGTEAATPIINVSQCESIDFLQSDDLTGGGAACTAVHRLEMCPASSADYATEAAKNASCAQLPGTTDLTGDDVETNLTGVWVRVRGTAVGANLSSCRVILKCVGD